MRLPTHKLHIGVEKHRPSGIYFDLFMRILSQYVLREFLTPLFYCITGFLAIYVIFEMFESFNRIMEAKPPLWALVCYFAGYVSPYLEWLIPAALLLGTLYTMWNFCRHSEVTAMRANGISFIVIVRPLLAVAALMALVVAGINEFYAPWASEDARNLREAHFRQEPEHVFERVPYYNQPAGRVWRINKMTETNSGVLEGVRISCNRNDGSRELDITASKAEYLDGMWWLHYPKYQYFDELGNPIENPLPILAKQSIRAFPGFNEKPRDFLLTHKSWDYFPIRDMIHYMRYHPNLDEDDRASKQYDIYARVAAPLSCIVITLFAIPAGVATGRQSVFKGVIIAVAMFFAFYALSIGCMILAKNALVPALPAAWCANVVFLVVGVALFHRQR